MNKIPTYKVKIDPNKKGDGVYAISLVETPAIEHNFIALKEHQKIDLKFSVDKDKKELKGPFLIPDKKIYRKIGEEEFYIVFDKEVIETIAEKYMGDGNLTSFNLEHSDKTVQGFIKESFILQEDKDGLPIGTWYGTVKIKDDKIWDDYIKQEKVLGFSVEIKATELELTLNKNKNFMKKSFKLEDIVEIIDALKEGVTEETTVEEIVSQIEDIKVEIAESILEEVAPEVEEVELEEEVVVEDATKSVEELVNDLLAPVMEKYDGMFEALQSQISTLEAALVIAKEETVSEDVVELKKQVIALKAIVSKTPGTTSLNKVNDIKLKKETDTLNKISFLQSFKK